MVAAGPGLRDARAHRQPRRRHRGGQVRHRHRFLRGAVRMTRVVVTGAAGFIGTNIIKGLNARGIDNIIAVDDLTQGDKFRNLRRPADRRLHRCRRRSTTCSPRALRQGGGRVPRGRLQRHDGAGRQVHDGQQLRACPARCSRPARSAARACSTPRRPRSTAARTPSAKRREFELPLNVYGYSKLLFDQRMRRECGRDFKRTQAPGGGLSLLQRLRPARAAQGPHGQRGLPPVQPVPRRRARSSCSASTAATAPASRRATSSSSTTWWR